MTFKVPEKYRLLTGGLPSTPAYGNNGAFKIKTRIKGKNRYMAVIASDGEGWEHVSVSLPDRAPLWAEMCQIKALFWGQEDEVFQFHPKESDYVNYHPYALHMWRKVGENTATPPSYMVGPKTKQLV